MRIDLFIWWDLVWAHLHLHRIGPEVGPFN